MRKLFFILITLILVPFQSCDDGDIITIELDFDDTFEACGSTNLILFKTKEDPSENEDCTTLPFKSTKVPIRESFSVLKKV